MNLYNLYIHKMMMACHKTLFLWTKKNKHISHYENRPLSVVSKKLIKIGLFNLNKKWFSDLNVRVNNSIQVPSETQKSTTKNMKKIQSCDPLCRNCNLKIRLRDIVVNLYLSTWVRNFRSLLWVIDNSHFFRKILEQKLRNILICTV